MNPNTHVYCTNCFNFRLDNEELPYCYFENKCDINDFEDSRPFKERPYYEKLERSDYYKK